jgi:enamine deaminase RidA (YjgF/YER057c/UK114 family)
VCGSRYVVALNLSSSEYKLIRHVAGWDPSQEFDPDTIIKADLMEEIDQAFANVDYNLKHAGGKGWSQVFRVTTYSTDIPPQHDRIVENLRKWMPDHTAVWTEVGVKQLGLAAMHFEIEVEAYDEEGAAEARKAKAKAA